MRDDLKMSGRTLKIYTEVAKKVRSEYHRLSVGSNTVHVQYEIPASLVGKMNELFAAKEFDTNLEEIDPDLADIKKTDPERFAKEYKSRLDEYIRSHTLEVKYFYISNLTDDSAVNDNKGSHLTNAESLSRVVVMTPTNLLSSLNRVRQFLVAITEFNARLSAMDMRLASLFKNKYVLLAKLFLHECKHCWDMQNGMSMTMSKSRHVDILRWLSDRYGGAKRERSADYGAGAFAAKDLEEVITWLKRVASHVKPILADAGYDVSAIN